MQHDNDLAAKIFYGGAVITAQAEFDINHSPEYAKKIHALVQQLLEIPTDRLMDHISTMHTISPLFDPTRYRDQVLRNPNAQSNEDLFRIMNSARAKIMNLYSITLQDLEKMEPSDGEVSDG